MDYQSYGGPSSSYGGMAGAGGGFVPGGYGVSPSSQSPAGGDKKGRIALITPVSINQLMKQAQQGADDNFTLDGKELDKVLIVGLVREVDNKTTKKTYTIEDHTGVTTVTHWIEDGDDANMPSAEQECREGMYVRVVGHLKTFRDEKSLNAFKVEPLTNTNQITQHLLDIVHMHLFNTRGPIGGNAPSTGNTNAVDIKPMAHGPGQGYGAYSAGMQQQMNSSTGNEVQSSVFECIKSGTEDAGVSIDKICSVLKDRFKENDIRGAVEWLSNEGHVYSTIDDDHYKSTDT
eukprot:m.336474 g.336474  ORF g.336474 m.336474 type:complete len:289 (-) comp17862_c0_seq1:180-1046(-)